MKKLALALLVSMVLTLSACSSGTSTTTTATNTMSCEISTEGLKSSVDLNYDDKYAVKTMDNVQVYTFDDAATKDAQFTILEEAMKAYEGIDGLTVKLDNSDTGVTITINYDLEAMSSDTKAKLGFSEATLVDDNGNVSVEKYKSFLETNGATCSDLK